VNARPDRENFITCTLRENLIRIKPFFWWLSKKRSVYANVFITNHLYHPAVFRNLWLNIGKTNSQRAVMTWLPTSSISLGVAGHFPYDTEKLPFILSITTFQCRCETLPPPKLFLNVATGDYRSLLWLSDDEEKNILLVCFTKISVCVSKDESVNDVNY
jgi:hypothetical protein